MRWLQPLAMLLEARGGDAGGSQWLQPLLSLCFPLFFFFVLSVFRPFFLFCFSFFSFLSVLSLVPSLLPLSYLYSFLLSFLLPLHLPCIYRKIGERHGWGSHCATTPRLPGEARLLRFSNTWEATGQLSKIRSLVGVFLN